MATSVSAPTVSRPAPRRTAPPEPFDYESIPAGYYDEVFRRGRGMQSKWHHLKFGRVARELEGHKRVLDVGCGPGTLAGNFADGHDWVGTDLSARQIAYARREYGRTGARFYRETPAGVPTDEGPFDAVTMVELIEHLEPAVVDVTIAEALERLRPGGKLVITTPNFHSAWPALEAAVNRFGDVSYGFQHINRFVPARLEELLARHGLAAPRAEQFLLLGPFAAALGWRAADVVARLDGGAQRRLGLLLIGSAYKPQ
jgi:2-polyprenyl-3-methyl-5-hydroxy-6-metoxy-1,4-benzoquinol methylase